jgi:hypothetical protein
MSTVDRDRCQELTAAKRPNYFAGQLLTERDLRDEQSYFRAKNGQHNRYLHGHGVVCGLRVVPADPARLAGVVVEPGLALDPWGREIVVPEAVELDLGEQGWGEALAAGRPESLFVVLIYHEQGADLLPGPSGPASTGSEEAVPSRILETFRFELRRTPPEEDDPISLQLCRLVADAVRQGIGAERFHRLLCEVVSQPCPPCTEEPGVTLARIDLPPRGPITKAQIDNCSHRHLVLSTDRIVHILLCLVASQV